MSHFARILEQFIELVPPDPRRSLPAAPEVVALAALVVGCLRDPTLSWRAREAGSLEEILDCLAADRVIIHTRLSIDPAVLRAADTGDMLRAVLDRAGRQRP